MDWRAVPLWISTLLSVWGLAPWEPPQVNPTFLAYLLKDLTSWGSGGGGKHPQAGRLEVSKTSQTTSWSIQGEGCFHEAAKKASVGLPWTELEFQLGHSPPVRPQHVNGPLFASLPTYNVEIIILTSEGSYKTHNTSSIAPKTWNVLNKSAVMAPISVIAQGLFIQCFCFHSFLIICLHSILIGIKLSLNVLFCFFGFWLCIFAYTLFFLKHHSLPFLCA